MTADRSPGRRDGFERWVATMKRGHEAVAAKPAALKNAVPELVLELDENATHVHRIPKEVMSRMREKESREKEAAEEDARDSLAGVSDDLTAVFRPPPELLARAKRMRPPAKPNVNEAPTQPPPPLIDAELEHASVPAAPRVPSVAGAPPVAEISSAPAPRPAPAPRRAGAPVRVVPVAPIVVGTTGAAAMARQAERDSQVAREIEAGWDDEAPTGDAVTRLEARGALFDADESGSGVVPVAGSALPILAAPELETAGDFAPESSPPTTTAPVVHTDLSVPPEAPSPLLRNIALFVLGVVVLVAFALWKSRY